MTTEMIGRVCDRVRTELENRHLNRYINSILTAYVFRQPPDYEAGLGLLLRVRGIPPFPSSKIWADESRATPRNRTSPG